MSLPSDVPNTAIYMHYIPVFSVIQVVPKVVQNLPGEPRIPRIQRDIVVWHELANNVTVTVPIVVTKRHRITNNSDIHRFIGRRNKWSKSTGGIAASDEKKCPEQN